MRFTTTENAERPVAKLDELLDSLGLRPIVRHFGKGKIHILDAGGNRRLTQMHEAFGIGIRQWPKKNSVNDAEDSRVRADPQSKRQNEGQGKAWCFPETPNCNS